MEAKKISFKDIIDTIVLESALSFVGENVINYIDIEGYVETKKLKEEVKQITSILPNIEDKEKRKELLSRLTNINKELK
jgi:hypothetical protein